VTPRLRDDIKQTKPFTSLEAEAYLNLMLLTEELSRDMNRLFKSANLSQPQYNVLRILRGASDKGRTCREVGDRMIVKVPDVTRLLDRLELRGLVERRREDRDRRIVRVRITRAGLDLLRPLDKPIADNHVAQLGHLGERKLRQLIKLLEEARENFAQRG